MGSSVHGSCDLPPVNGSFFWRPTDKSIGSSRSFRLTWFTSDTWNVAADAVQDGVQSTSESGKFVVKGEAQARVDAAVSRYSVFSSISAASVAAAASRVSVASVRMNSLMEWASTVSFASLQSEVAESKKSAASAASVSSAAAGSRSEWQSISSTSSTLGTSISSITPPPSVPSPTESGSPQESDPSVEPVPQSSSKGIGSGAIAGIVVSIVVVIAFGAAFFLLRRRRKQKPDVDTAWSKPELEGDKPGFIPTAIATQSSEETAELNGETSVARTVVANGNTRSAVHSESTHEPVHEDVAAEIPELDSNTLVAELREHPTPHEAASVLVETGIVTATSTRHQSKFSSNPPWREEQDK